MNETQAASLLQAPKGDTGPSYFRVWMPYLYQKVEHQGRKRHVFLPLNRAYKPLGFLNGEHYVYEDYLASHGVTFSGDPSEFGSIWWNSNETQFWLYDDTPKSRIDYFGRLERLMLKHPVLLKEAS